MNKLRHLVGAIVIFVGFISLFASIYNGMIDNYGITPQDTKDGKTIIEKLEGLHLLAGINEIGDAIHGLGNAKITNPADILGNLASAGTGLLKIIGGVVTFVPQVFGIIFDFYEVPGIISTILGSLIIVYVGFIILSAYMRYDL